MTSEYRDYYCYFVISSDAQVIYIGVSYAKDAQAILRKHLRGEVPATENVFGPGPDQIVPILHARPSKYRTKQDAAEEADGWCHYFTQEKYRVILPDGVRYNPVLSVAAKKLLSENENKTVYGVLWDRKAENYYSKPKAGKKVSALQKYTAEPADIILSFRVTSSAATAFEEIYETSDCTKGQLFASMIDEYTSEFSLLEEDLAGRLKRANAAISALKQEHTAQKAELEKRIQRLKGQRDVIQSMVGFAVKFWFFRNYPQGSLIPIYKRKHARRYFRNRCSYPYPSRSGTALIQVDCLCYGKSNRNRGQVIFLYGREISSGDKIKLRCYFRRELIGRHPRIDEYRNDSIWWQVGFEVVQDGAVDLIGAIPIPRTVQQAGRSEKKTSYRNYLPERELTQTFPDDSVEQEVSLCTKPPSPRENLDAAIEFAKYRAGK